MYAVQEYDEEGDYINHTPFLIKESAVEFSKEVNKYQPSNTVIVVEIDFDNQGEAYGKKILISRGDS